MRKFPMLLVSLIIFVRSAFGLGWSDVSTDATTYYNYYQQEYLPFYYYQEQQRYADFLQNYYNYVQQQNQQWSIFSQQQQWSPLYLRYEQWIPRTSYGNQVLDNQLHPQPSIHDNRFDARNSLPDRSQVFTPASTPTSTTTQNDSAKKISSIPSTTTALSQVEVQPSMVENEEADIQIVSGFGENSALRIGNK